MGCDFISVMKRLYFVIRLYIYTYCSYILFPKTLGRIRGLRTIGMPIVDISVTGKFVAGNNMTLINNSSSTLGRNTRCKLVVYPNALLCIGDDVGMSNTTIVSTKRILIGNNVLIGGGTIIVDSDFHSMNPEDWHTSNDELNMLSKDVVIGNNVFIGMNTIILKGVHIGNNVIVAAGAVVTQSIPNNQIWGGNPAVFIKARKI